QGGTGGCVDGAREAHRDHPAAPRARRDGAHGPAARSRRPSRAGRDPRATSTLETSADPWQRAVRDRPGGPRRGRLTPPFVYFDTSVVVKRYVWEPSPAVARTLLRRYRCLSSAILPVEVISAVNRRQATGDLATADFSAILSRIGEDRRRWELVPVTGSLLALAEDLVRRNLLRTLDAIHLAAALTFRSTSGLRVPFATADA